MFLFNKNVNCLYKFVVSVSYCKNEGKIYLKKCVLEF